MLLGNAFFQYATQLARLIWSSYEDSQVGTPPLPLPLPRVLVAHPPYPSTAELAQPRLPSPLYPPCYPSCYPPCPR